MSSDSKVTREQLLKGAAASLPTVLLSGAARDALAAGGPEAHAAASSLKGKNVVMFITDQEATLRHFPKGWAKKNLPGAQRLIRNGLEFKNAFTNSCMCSPSRATLLTGYLPAQHGVRYTLESDMPPEEYPQVELPPTSRTSPPS
ncbi:MAG: sulfatase-like hydrolase/transferase [Solirubrobacterales bacterium]